MKKPRQHCLGFLFHTIYRQEDFSPAFEVYHNKNKRTSNQTYALYHHLISILALSGSVREQKDD
ncbi:hypothetical protein CRN48_09165 [Vibrio vulnificus]|nr:hypothetical protein JS87_13590 [Vibrio vulnificus]POC46816.1 hypothetical protein CRN48_09165 [Vibrio vulnificus]